MKNVYIGSLIRNRGWILSIFLEHLYKLDYSKKNISMFFLLNDSQDNSYTILECFKDRYLNEYRNIRIGTVDLGGEYADSSRVIRNRYNMYKRLSFLRNIIIRSFLVEDYDYLFFIDSDILVEPDCLERLIENNKDICAALVQNHYKDKIYNFMFYDENKRRFYRPIDFKLPDKIFEVDLTGACYLIKKKVIEVGVKYDFNIVGEDGGFCLKAKERGFKLYVDPTIKTLHIMRKEDLKKYGITI